jgi:Transglutaminase-like superfamily
MVQGEETSDSRSVAAEAVTTLSRRESALLIAKTLLRNPAALIKFWVMTPGEERYVLPPRRYELPAFHDRMQHCTSDEKYLRPTLYCNPREPIVIAMANELGAYEKPDYEFAEAAYEFITRSMTLAVCPFEDVGTTLEKGTGSCWNLMNVFVALCRAGGVKARYMGVKRALTEEDQEAMSRVDPFFARIYVAMSDIFGLAEAYIDGEWVGADLTASPEIQAVRGLPIKKFGEGLIASETVDDPSQEWHSESMPRFAARGMVMLRWLAPAMNERINVGILKQYALGREIIEKAGGIEAYDRNARRRRRLLSGAPMTEQIMRLTKDAERKQVLVFEEY